MPENPVLELKGIEKSYFGTRVLKGIDLALHPGEIHALLGENGAGKSTLMNILFGMPVIRETGGFSGEVRLAGDPVSIQSPQEAMRRGIGMVHQEFMLIPGFEVCENIKLNREPLRGLPVRSLDLIDVPRMRRESRESLARIRLDISERTLVADLPVGHMQFVEIAREVDKGDVRVLVFDEPTAVLTESEAETLLSVMRDLAERGIAILFITHRLGEVMSVADTVTILRDGELVSCTRKDDTSIPEIAERMVGRDVSSDARTGVGGATEITSEPILRVEALRVAMPGEEVRGVDFEVAEGEIFGIGGLAGQGKIGIANGIMGLSAATGRVTIAGEELRLNSPKTALGRGLAFVSEDRRGVGLLLDESVEMNIAIPAIEIHRQFLKAHFLGPFAPVDRAAVRHHARQAIADLDIRTTGPQQVVRRLSGGNQQKVCLARALVLEPRLLLVSEPTRGIDVGAKELILDRLRKLNREQGLTILMTSSELGELRSLCHRIAIVSEGRIAGILAPDAPDVTYGLLMSGGAAVSGLTSGIMERLKEGARSFGLARWVIVSFLGLIWFIAGFYTDNNLGTLLGDCLVRSGMNGLLVLALVLPVRAGSGLNFGLPLGIVCGLVGGIFSLELAATAPFGLTWLSGIEAMSRDWTGFLIAHAVALPLGALVGFAFGWLLERVRGQEMMVGIYVGFGAVAGMCVVWLKAPLTSSELIWPIGGEGVRNTIVLQDYYKWILDSFGAVNFGSFPADALDAAGNPPAFTRPEGFYIPTGLLVFWLGACGLMALFLRTRMGTALTAAGENPEYARSIGIPVARMRVWSIVLSTMLAASGILVYSQSYGFFQLYKAALWMAFAAVASLLLGGASLRRATVMHVIVGTFLFQSLLTTSLPTVNDLVQNSPYREGLANLPEIARLVIQNGVILYALTRVSGRGRS